MRSDRASLEKRYGKLSDEQLLEMLVNKEDYTPEAQEVFCEEISRRDIDKAHANEFIQKKTKQKERARARAAKAALVPMTFGEKFISYIGTFLPQFLSFAVGNYSQDGFILKARQYTYYKLCGIVVTIISFVLGMNSSAGLGFCFFPIASTIVLMLEKKIVKRPVIER